MFFAGYRARRALKQPVEGQFQVSAWYDTNPNGSPRPPMLTGVISAPGIPPVAGQCRADSGGRWAGNNILPALVDRTDPARFVVLWKQVPTHDWAADAKQAAERAARDAGQQQPFEY